MKWACSCNSSVVCTCTGQKVCPYTSEKLRESGLQVIVKELSTCSKLVQVGYTQLEKFRALFAIVMTDMVAGQEI